MDAELIVGFDSPRDNILLLLVRLDQLDIQVERWLEQQISQIVRLEVPFVDREAFTSVSLNIETIWYRFG